MSRSEGLRPVRAALQGPQGKATVILLASTILMLSWKYFGSPQFYREHFASRLVLWDDPGATAGVYCLLCCLLLLGVVPAGIVKLVFRQRLADYGLQWGDRRAAIRFMLLLGPVFLLLGYLSSLDAAVRSAYPVNPSAGESPQMFVLHVVTYLLFYLGWEFHFRGFLQFGLLERFGPVNAVLVQVMASSLVHIGQPAAETYGAILGGILWGAIALRTRSLLAGLAQHALLGISLDWFLCYW